MSIALKTIPKAIENKVSGPKKRIPRIIHQTYRASEIPEKMFDAAMSWVEMNPDYEYRFHDDDDQIAFLKERFDPDVSNAYEKIKEGAFRADFWRYCILYEYGGIYADIDTVCKMSLNDLVGDDDEFIVPMVTAAQPSAVFNAFICAMPGHPFLERAIEYTTRMTHRSWLFDGFNMVGPGALGAAMNLSLGRHKSAPHREGNHKADGMRYRILKRASAEGNVPSRVVAQDKTVFLSRYDGHFEDLTDINETHWLANQRKRGWLLHTAHRIANRFR